MVVSSTRKHGLYETIAMVTFGTDRTRFSLGTADSFLDPVRFVGRVVLHCAVFLPHDALQCIVRY